MSPPLDSYQIGWICALPIEVAAAKQMLDEDFGILDHQDSADTNSYILGRIGKHHIVIAGLPGGQYGTTSATVVAINMMRTFSQSLRIGLMVGIGGGIPSVKADVRLGDIVVSYPEGTCGGVIQYDMGKVLHDNRFQQTGSLNSPPRSLLTAVATMRAAELTDDPKYPEYIEKVISKNARTKRNFGRPDITTDRLFKIEYDHPMTATICGSNTCLPEWEEIREPREELYPEVFYGVIASGNKVIKHGATRERLRQEIGALCFEMEAAGLMMDFPCIVIRGICDYSDSHKHKQWQGYASLAAASYAKELLGYIPVGRVSQEGLVTELCSEMVKEAKQTNKHMETLSHQQVQHHLEKMTLEWTKEQHECHRAFKTSIYEQHKNINPDRVDGTCQWILNNAQYTTWCNNTQNDLLWVSADPGCGKSVLAKSLIDKDFKKASLASVCYFFFKDNDEQNSLTTALCAVLHQLFSLQPNLLVHALNPWQRTGIKIQEEDEELWRILIAAISDPQFTNTICIFDALDECKSKDRSSLINKLEVFYKQENKATNRGGGGGGWLKFFVTSRPYDDIERDFSAVTQTFPAIHIRGEEENSQVHDEISLVVKMRVSELANTLQLGSDIQSRLEKQLLDMEHRTYLWLHLAMDDIENQFRNSLEPDDESIELIPNSVRDAYQKILNRVPTEKKEDALLILKIIVGARRPLTVEQMAVALGIGKANHSQNDATKSNKIRKSSALKVDGLGEKIRRLCGLFIFIQETRIYLIHQTAREFLLDNEQIWSFKVDDLETLLANVCIDYLLYEDHDDDDKGDKETEMNMKTPPFRKYASIYWPKHVRDMPLEAELQVSRQIDELYDVDSKCFGRWFSVMGGNSGLRATRL